LGRGSVATATGYADKDSEGTDTFQTVTQESALKKVGKKQIDVESVTGDSNDSGR
jgi:hypothetical protein